MEVEPDDAFTSKQSGGEARNKKNIVADQAIVTNTYKEY